MLHVNMYMYVYVYVYMYMYMYMCMYMCYVYVSDIYIYKAVSDAASLNRRLSDGLYSLTFMSFIIRLPYL